MPRQVEAISPALVESAEGASDCGRASAEDIDARKQAEARLHEATERLTLAARAGGVGIFDYDIVNDSLVWDEQMFELYGIPKAQFRGAYETWRDGLHPEDRVRPEMTDIVTRFF